VACKWFTRGQPQGWLVVTVTIKRSHVRIFVAGATGAIGRQLVPKLLAAGHEVSAMTRTASKREAIRALGAQPVVADALSPESVAAAVAQAEPEVIIHELTAIPASLDIRHLDRDFAATNRLRTEGTDNLLSAGAAVGVDRFIAQSYAGWPVARTGPMVADEQQPLDPTPARPMRETHAAIRHLEEAVSGSDWTAALVLRYGALYGPGTSLATNGEQTEMIRRRRFPVIGGGEGVWSFLHVQDAAEATVRAVEQGASGIYNIVDDDPAPVSEWLPATSKMLGAGPPRHVPRVIGRLLAGEAATVMMTAVRGASNEKAKRELGWTPTHPSWRDGFAQELT
jgi:nucleoside-diphosphate-sugar epimerase